MTEQTAYYLCIERKENLIQRSSIFDILADRLIYLILNGAIIY